MPDPNFVRVNGTIYSWTSCAHFFQGIPYKGLVAVNFTESRERKLVHAAQQDGTPLGTTSGLYKVEALSFRFLKDSAHALLTDLTAFGLGSYGDAKFNYTMQLFEPPAVGQIPSLPLSILITGCEVTKVDDKHELGTDELVTELTCQAQLLVRTYGGVPLKLWSTLRTLIP